jgi:phospholipid/cholesterol/gamma-HCH transport system permease protein
MAGNLTPHPGTSLGGAAASTSAAATPLSLPGLNPFRLAIDLVGYLGKLALLALAAFRGMFRGARPGEPSFVSETLYQLDRLLGVGLPLVGLVHVGMGSFLSMQAYFGATFMDGIGPVTGVGLIRNLAPLLVGFLLAGIVSVRYVSEFRGKSAEVLADPGPLVAPRIMAAAIAGPVLSVWGSLVGIAVGWLVANSMMGLTLPAFFDMFLEMLWERDITGLVFKGVIFGGLAALLACYEGIVRPGGPEAACDFESIGAAVCRAVCLAGMAILFVNSAWFLLLYHAGPPFGPTVLTPQRE